MANVKNDPFYSESNMAHLKRGTEALNAGKGIDMLDRSMEQIARGEGKIHELIEIEDDD